MRNSVIIVLSGIILLVEALVAHADDAGPATGPAVGTANPPPPAAASDIGQQEPPKPVLGGNSAMKTNGIPTDNRAVGPFTGADTSTAGPGGQAESSANGALSSPPNEATAQQPDHKKKSAAEPGSPASSRNDR
jgi:hypothetical protein